MRRALLFTASLALLLATPAGAYTDHAAPAKSMTAPAAHAPSDTRDPRAYFTDLELRTHHDEVVRFYSDTMEGRTVVINFIYTHCRDACPLITQKMLQVRDLLGDRFNKDVFFITITSDPARDTPAELRKFAQKQSADVPGWLFLTGSKTNISAILKKFGSYSPNVEEHSTLLLAGNVPVKRWAKMRPDAPAQLIAERIVTLATTAEQAAKPE